MGKIFGISDNPVSTIESSLRGVEVPKPTVLIRKVVDKNVSDRFISKEKANKPNAFIKMRNGVGKLMSHFNRSK